MEEEIKEYLQYKLNKDLAGNIVKAFGIDSGGFWGSYDQELEFKISEIEVDDILIDDLYLKKPKLFASVNVILENYNPDLKYGLIYTDPKFIKSFKKLVKSKGYNPKDFDYSEQGMQGYSYVNLDADLIKYLDKKFLVLV